MGMIQGHFSVAKCTYLSYPFPKPRGNPARLENVASAASMDVWDGMGNHAYVEAVSALRSGRARTSASRESHRLTGRPTLDV